MYHTTLLTTYTSTTSTSMLRRTLTRRIALKDVTTQHLRPSCRIPSSILAHIPKTPITTRAASSSTTTTNDPPHTSLSSFLAHARRTNLDRSSTTFTGTYYEYVTQALLRKYGFELTRVGGRGDRGVDLKGIWRIVTAGGPTKKDKVELEIPVVVQCKRLKGKVGPNLIRELEGAVATGKKGGGNTMGVLVGTRGATKGVREAMGRSRVGICWVMLEVGEGGIDEMMEEEAGEGEGEEEQKEQGFDGILQAMKDEIVSKAPGAVREMMQPEAREAVNGSGEGKPEQLGRVCQMLWNRAASDLGLEGLEVVMKYDGTRDENGEVGKEVKLMWQGKSVLEVPERSSG